MYFARQISRIAVAKFIFCIAKCKFHATFNDFLLPAFTRAQKVGRIVPTVGKAAAFRFTSENNKPPCLSLGGLLQQKFLECSFFAQLSRRQCAG